MTNKVESKNVWVHCSNCGSDTRNHRVLHEHTEPNADEYQYYGESYHQLLQCMGCAAVRYRRFDMDEYHRDEITHQPEPFNDEIFPHIQQGRHSSFNAKSNPALIPSDVLKMYLETLAALNSNALTLAGGGLRATVEAICLNQGITNGSLEKKIDSLVQRQLLTTSQAELLHEERYIGNAALHEMTTPSAEDIEDGLQIVEGLINTIYILPVKAKRLKKVREKAEKKKQANKATRSKPRKGSN
jgi:hypothetical protein